MDKETFEKEFAGLSSRLDDAVAAMESATDDDSRKALETTIETLQTQVTEFAPVVEKLKRDEADQKAQAEITSLREAVQAMRSEVPNAELPDDGGKAIYGDVGEYSFYSDFNNVCRKPGFASAKALERLNDAKAMVEHSDAQGGFLVPTQRFNEWIKIREANNIVRALVSKVNVKSDSIEIPVQTSGLKAGWVAELAEKPISDMSFGMIGTNVFTAAGMSVVSNQLLDDSNPSIDRLINSELATRLAHVEEQAFINGSGVGQPLGILNTPGVQSIVLETGDEGNDLAVTIIDAVLDALGAVQGKYLGAPNAILMHTNTWTTLLKAKVGDDNNAYLLGGPTVEGRTATSAVPGGLGPMPVGVLFGVPVYTTPNMPADLGEDENETRIIVGNWSEGLILDRHGVRLDSSDQVFFTSNRTIFRAEIRVGFTASRYPEAFCVIGGPDLAIGE